MASKASKTRREIHGEGTRETCDRLRKLDGGSPNKNIDRVHGVRSICDRGFGKKLFVLLVGADLTDIGQID